MIVTISRLSTYRVSGCSPAIDVGTISPRSLYASTSNVAGLAAFVSDGLYFSNLLATAVGHLDFALLRRLGSADLGVAVGAPLPHGGDLVAQLLVARPVAQERFQVVAGVGEEASEKRAFG